MTLKELAELRCEEKVFRTEPILQIFALHDEGLSGCLPYPLIGGPPGAREHPAGGH